MPYERLVALVVRGARSFSQLSFLPSARTVGEKYEAAKGNKNLAAMTHNPNWRPKLGDFLQRGGGSSNPVKERFVAMGFQLQRTLEVQSACLTGDKNYEGRKFQVGMTLTGEETMPAEAHETKTVHEKHEKHEGAPDQRVMGLPLTAALPVVITIDQSAMGALKSPQQPPPLAQDLGRFAGKVLIAGVGWVAASLVIHWLTAPPAAPGA